MPEKARLADAANFVAARGDTFGAVLADEFAQRVYQFGLDVVEQLVVRAEIDRRIGSASILLAILICAGVGKDAARDGGATSCGP